MSLRERAIYVGVWIGVTFVVRPLAWVMGKLSPRGGFGD